MKTLVVLLIAAVALGLGWLGMITAQAGSGPPDDGMCPDLTGDKKVLIADVLFVVTSYFSADEAADLNDNGVVQVDDILLTVQHYFMECTYPTPQATPYDYGEAPDPPVGWASPQDWADDLADDGLANHSNGGAGGGIAGIPVTTIDCELPGGAAVIDFSGDDVQVTCPEGPIPTPDGFIPPGVAGHAGQCVVYTNDWVLSGKFQTRGHTNCTGGNFDNLHSQTNWRYCGWTVVACTWFNGGTYDQEACMYCITLQTQVNNNVPIPPYIGINCRSGKTWHSMWEHIGQTEQVVVTTTSDGECR